ncbi:hypothetical protein SAY87_007913 [Trapa incisa]|uniref:HIG1 domain-containing protein n=1 Tax=Trapa incisa TaxID=236973 RepID=A0AAN7KFT8_9MYRT|nr:hypothetical protein SAY87_007913 [Trapa incisa]
MGIGHRSIAGIFTCQSPLKPSLRLIHARMHAQALTLAVLSSAAAYHYYEQRTARGEPNNNQGMKKLD